MGRPTDFDGGGSIPGGQNAAGLRQLNRRITLTKLAAAVILLLGMISLALYFDPLRVGIPADRAAEFRGMGGWLAAGIGLLIGGLVFLWAAGRRERRLKWILETRKPQPMQLEIEVGREASQFYARLFPAEAEEAGWRAALWPAPPALHERAGKRMAAWVYRDPQNGRPAAIAYPGGLLWVRSGPGAVERLPREREP